MSSLPILMKNYIKETKGRIDFNNIPEQVIRFTKKLSVIDLHIAYSQMTHKEHTEKTVVEMINEMIFMLIDYKRKIY